MGACWCSQKTLGQPDLGEKPKKIHYFHIALQQEGTDGEAGGRFLRSLSCGVFALAVSMDTQHLQYLIIITLHLLISSSVTRLATIIPFE